MNLKQNVFQKPNLALQKDQCMHFSSVVFSGWKMKLLAFLCFLLHKICISIFI